MKVKMFQSTYQFSCNVYVVSSDKGNILIDPGHYDDEIREYIDQIGGLDAILLTHGHWDHTFGLDHLKADFPDVPVYMPVDGHDFLQDPYLNGSIFNGFEVRIQSEVNTVEEGSLQIADMTLMSLTRRATAEAVPFIISRTKTSCLRATPL